jgi:hypothetical protein
VIDLKLSKPMKLQKKTISMFEPKKKFQKAPKSSKAIKTHSIMNSQNTNLQIFQKKLAQNHFEVRS